jgi:dephospho-CoA kinase
MACPDGTGRAAVLVIGLTGGIACGKSTAAAALEAAGAPVVRSDVLAREVVEPGEPALEEIRSAFGPAVIRPDGRLNRRALAEIVFRDPEARRVLERITHPRIHRRMLQWLEERRREGQPAAVCDIPLLFEAGYHRRPSFLDRIWVVRVRPETQLQRLMARDGLDREAALRRIAAQWPLEHKAALADLVFDNEGTPEELAARVRAAWRAVLEEVRRAGGGPAGGD